MKIEDIAKTVITQIERIKKLNLEPGSIVVSKNIMYDIERDYYSITTGERYPYYPSFASAKEERIDTFYGLPISSITTNKEDYIMVYCKVPS